MKETPGDEEKKAISSSILPQQLPWRFIRLHPRFNVEETLDLLLKVDRIPSIRPVPWSLSSNPPSSTSPPPSLPFYAIPGETNLPSTTAYRTGRIYGQDVSSGQAVAVLLEDLDSRTECNNNNIRILDLCASPGLKLCAMADLCFARGCPNVTIVGVDISRDRLHLCQRLLQKYQSSSQQQVHIQLYWGDGTTWGLLSSSLKEHELVYDSRVAEQQLQLQDGQKRRNKSARHRERKLLRNIQQQQQQQQQSQPCDELFDYVLVDAECSTDGSLSHRGGGGGEQHTTEEDLVALQRRLLQRGFDVLRPGCSLVYSTCSLEDVQNSGVVEQFLLQTTTAQTVPLYWTQQGCAVPPTAVRPARLPGTIQFYPSSDDPLFGSGLFVAKIRKSMNAKQYKG